MARENTGFFVTGFQKVLGALMAALFITAVATVALAQGSSGHTVQLGAGSVIPGQYIVVLKDGAGSPADVARALGKAHGLTVGHVYSHALNGFSASVPDAAVARLSKDPRVAYVEQDQIATISATIDPTGIRRIDGDTVTNTVGTTLIDGVDDVRVDVDVAVLDTGVDIDHPDLNVFSVVSYAGGDGDDGNGHGTHVSGTIGALDNGGDNVVGVAPGARIWAVKVLNNGGSGRYSNIIAGVNYVAANADQIEVANMSLGGGNSAALCTAVNNAVAAGVTFAVSAGNSSANASNYSPASCTDVITVSALADFDGLAGGLGSSTCRSDVDDTFANFSNYGSTVEIIAPGVCILSTWKSGGYNTISGTSMSSPHVAGAAALLAASGVATPAAILTALQTTGTDQWNASDDGDATKEPLLNVNNAAYNPATVSGGEEPALTNDAPVVGITAPADAANPASGADVTFTGTATDTEDDNAALTASISWSSSKDGALGTGGSLTIGDDEAALSDGIHTITASVTDSGAVDGTNAKSDNASISITMGTPPILAPFEVASVEYAASGGRSHDKNLTIAVTISPGVLGTSVSIELTNDNGGSWVGSGTTDEAGVVGWNLKNAPPGCYTTVVTDLDGMDPTPTTPDPVAPFCK